MPELTLEQDFELAKARLAAKMMAKEQLVHELIELTEMMMREENAYKQMLLESAGIVTPIFEDKK